MKGNKIPISMDCRTGEARLVLAYHNVYHIGIVHMIESGAAASHEVDTHLHKLQRQSSQAGPDINSVSISY